MLELEISNAWLDAGHVSRGATNVIVAGGFWDWAPSSYGFELAVPLGVAVLLYIIGATLVERVTQRGAGIARVRAMGAGSSLSGWITLWFFRLCVAVSWVVLGLGVWNAGGYLAALPDPNMYEREAVSVVVLLAVYTSPFVAVAAIISFVYRRVLGRVERVLARFPAVVMVVTVLIVMGADLHYWHLRTDASTSHDTRRSGSADPR